MTTEAAIFVRLALTDRSTAALVKDIHAADSRTRGALPGERTDIVRVETLSSQLERLAARTVAANPEAAIALPSGAAFHGLSVVDSSNLHVRPPEHRALIGSWIDEGAIAVELRLPFIAGRTVREPRVGEQTRPEPVWHADPGTPPKAAAARRFQEQVEATLLPQDPPAHIEPSGVNNTILTDTLRSFVARPGARVDAPVRYQDGSIARPFPLRSLALRDALPEFKRQLRFALLSIRHTEMDIKVDGCWLRNYDISRPRPAAETDELVYALTRQQLATVTKPGPLKLELYQTGLDPAIVGFYRALVDHLIESPGSIAVLPMFYRHPPQESDNTGTRARDGYYVPGKAVDDVNAPTRGIGDTLFRDARCKDCLREQLTSTTIDPAADTNFEYSEAWATKLLDRGGSRTDRCARHRREHRQAIQGIAVAYVDLTTIGEVADRLNPTGPLGGLGELPATHRPKPVSIDLSTRQFGMTDDDIREALTKLGNDKTRVLVLKAGTGTGKSTFAPYRLMNPPRDRPGDENLLQLTSLGPIIVTEPRVQATTGVARFVGEKLVVGCKWKVCSEHGRYVPAVEADSEAPEGPDHPGLIGDDCVITDCSDHIGPGYPVGYQVKGDKKHDDSCQLIYVTDGTIVNWLRDGRLSKIGTVIVDEAHERSVNIDFIMGELKRQLARYPHLRVIVTSATFDLDFYVSFFGGPEVVASMNVPAVKSFGYGAPLFPYPSKAARDLGIPACVCPPIDSNQAVCHANGDPTNHQEWIGAHWPVQSPEDLAKYGDLRALTGRLERLRYNGPLIDDPDKWRFDMPGAATAQITRMVTELDDMKIGGDILSFLPTEKMITATVDSIRTNIGESKTDVFGLIGSMPKDLQAEALAARPPGARRKVVIATNLAETSLTVEGVRFVVDSGIITQSVWEPKSASGSVPTRPHSQSGIRQRWGRVGRDAPGWVFPLYTEKQFSTLPMDTPPGSTRENLEKLVMTAKAGGVDDIDDFPWPAMHEFGNPDRSARDARETFIAELSRANNALEKNGIVNEYGHLTQFGKEVQRFAVVGASATTALAIMIADQLACVPEVATAIALLEGQDLFGADKLFLDDRDWPPLLRAEAAWHHRPLLAGCSDDLDLVLRIATTWDHADPSEPPWKLTPLRRDWCWRTWINPAVLQKAAEFRHDTLEALSPAMKEDVKRLLDIRLTERVRAVLSRATTSLQYERAGDGRYRSVADGRSPAAQIDKRALMTGQPDRLIAMSRTYKRTDDGEVVYLKHLVRVLPWAQADDLDVFQLVELAALHASPRALTTDQADPLLRPLSKWPVGVRFTGALGDPNPARLRTIAQGQVVVPATPPPGTKLAAEESPTEPTSRESNWLLGAPMPDEDRLAQQPVDTADDPDDPEVGTESNDVGSLADRIDDVVSLDSHAPPDTNRDRLPLVRLGASQLPDTRTMFACIGYEQDDDGEPILRLASTFYVLSADVPEENRGRVIGQGQRNIAKLREIPGILACEFDGREGPLLIFGIAEASIRSVLGEIDRAPTRFTGLMTMPIGASAGSLIGRGGATIAYLREESGCTWANYDRDQQIWELAGPSRESILDFIDLAGKILPGCWGEVVRPNNASMRIFNLVTGDEIVDWRQSRIDGCPVDAWDDVLQLELELSAVDVGAVDDPADDIDDDATGDEPDLYPILDLEAASIGSSNVLRELQRQRGEPDPLRNAEGSARTASPRTPSPGLSEESVGSRPLAAGRHQATTSPSISNVHRAPTRPMTQQRPPVRQTGRRWPWVVVLLLSIIVAVTAIVVARRSPSSSGGSSIADAAVVLFQPTNGGVSDAGSNFITVVGRPNAHGKILQVPFHATGPAFVRNPGESCVYIANGKHARIRENPLSVHLTTNIGDFEYKGTYSFALETPGTYSFLWSCQSDFPSVTLGKATAIVATSSAHASPRLPTAAPSKRPRPAPSKKPSSQPTTHTVIAAPHLPALPDSGPFWVSAPSVSEIKSCFAKETAVWHTKLSDDGLNDSNLGKPATLHISVGSDDTPYRFVIADSRCSAFTVAHLVPGHSYVAHLYVGAFWTLSWSSADALAAPGPISPQNVGESYRFEGGSTPKAHPTYVDVTVP